MNRFLSTSLLTLVVAASAAAQTDEKKFLQTQAKKLAAYAKKALKKGFPRQAKLVYLMAISEYDPDSTEAHKALGHVRVGTAWQSTPGFKFPKVSAPPSPSAAKSIRNAWLKLQKDLARAHKPIAAEFDKAGRKDRSEKHYRLILRFAPGDVDAQKALEHVAVSDGLSGTSMEKDLYSRGVRVDDVVKQEGSKDYPVEVLPDTDRHPILENAKLEYKSVKSEHFTIRGNYPVEVLKEAAVWAERAYQVVKVAYAGHEEMFVPDTKQWRSTQYSFFKTRDEYKQILNANRDQVKNPKDFEFLVEHTAGCTLGNLGVSASSSKKSVLDGAVRRVARSFSAFGADALSEGIGHTFVGLMLRNNRAFLVDRKEQIGTGTEEDEIDEFSPDMDMWEDLAVESAWKKTSVAAKELPLIHASKFDDEMRIKAWSFCHYLTLRNPALLRLLDACRRERNVIDIQKKFSEFSGKFVQQDVSLEQLDREWKDYFTGATPVMKAIKHRTDPMTAVSKGVKKWLAIINKIRNKTFYQAPLTWSASFSARCKDHADYLRSNDLSGPDHEQRQDPQLPGSTHPGNMFAQMAMVCTHAKDPKKVIEEWMSYPGYRDLFFVNTLRTIGLYAEKGIIVINVVQGLIRPRKQSFVLYPKSGMTRVKNQVKVADLGPEMKALLERAGYADRKVVGFPLSIHFGNAGRMPKRDSIHCKVTVNGRKKVEGILHIADDGNHRRTAAPGVAVFYPLSPIRKGSEVKVVWTFENGDRLETFDATYHH